MQRDGWTSIILRNSVKKRLGSYGNAGQSYQDVLIMLMDKIDNVAREWKMSIEDVLKKDRDKFKNDEIVIACCSCHSIKKYNGWTEPNEDIYKAIMNAKYPDGSRVFAVSHGYCSKCRIKQ